MAYEVEVIRSFKSKALAEPFASGKTARLDAKMLKRISVRLDVLDGAEVIKDLQLPGYDFHALQGFNPSRYTIHVNGPWCITFEFEDGDAFKVDFEQYH